MLGLTESISFTGRMDIHKIVPKMDVMVLSSISEAQPLSILEGHAFELPFVATDVGCCRELLYGNDGDNLGDSGIVVRPVSPAELAESILKLLKNKKLCKKMGKIGRQRVQSYYSFDEFIDKYRRLYKKYAG